MNSPLPDSADPFNPLILQAADVMQRQVVTVQASDPVQRVARTLVENKISGVPVLDDEGHLLGVVSMYDVLRHHTERAELPTSIDPHVFDDVVQETETVNFERAGDEACAGDLMCTDVVSVRPDTRLDAVAATMVDAGVHRVLVCTARNLLGIISSMDLMIAFARGVRAAN